jgi:hypothetical protein
MSISTADVQAAMTARTTTTLSSSPAFMAGEAQRPPWQLRLVEAEVFARQRDRQGKAGERSEECKHRTDSHGLLPSARGRGGRSRPKVEEERYGCTLRFDRGDG